MLLVRADASASMGVGHVMRCLSLAQEWISDGGAVTFAMRHMPDVLARKIEGSGISVERLGDDSAESLVTLAARLHARHAVIDGYHLDKAIQPALAAKGERTVLVIDDEGESATDSATLVLNQNPYAKKELYAQSAPHARFLLGPTYALLRREFRDLHEAFAAGSASGEEQRSRPRILVSLGGADVLNLTSLVMDALASMDAAVDQEVVVGAANPRAEELKARAKRPDCDVVVAVDDMATRMTRADLAIVAAGSTCYELACLGVPMLVIATAENQRSVQRSVVALGIGAALGTDPAALTSDSVRKSVDSLLKNDALRLDMRRRGRALVDGQGARRVVTALRDGERARA